jgi:hypothetical protein
MAKDHDGAATGWRIEAFHENDHDEFVQNRKPMCKQEQTFGELSFS